MSAVRVASMLRTCSSAPTIRWGGGSPSRFFPGLLARPAAGLSLPARSRFMSSKVPLREHERKTVLERLEMDARTWVMGSGRGDAGGKQGGRRSWHRFAGGIFGLGVAVACGFGAVTATALADEGKGKADDRSVPQMVTDLAKTVFSPVINLAEFVNELVSGEESALLEPQIKDPFGRRIRTLVLEFDGTLVHCVWTRHGGWVVRKRPYVDKFLERVQRAGYEVVLFSSQNQMDMEAFVNDLDVLGVMRTRLFKDSCNYKSGHRVKDLDRMNRDRKQVILVDHNKDSGFLQPDNCLVLPKFVDDKKDRELVRLAELLEDVQKYNVYDVRDVVRQYNKEPAIDFFAAEKLRANEAKRQLDEDDGVTSSKKKGGGWLGRVVKK